MQILRKVGIIIIVITLITLVGCTKTTEIVQTTETTMLETTQVVTEVSTQEETQISTQPPTQLPTQPPTQEPTKPIQTQPQTIATEIETELRIESEIIKETVFEEEDTQISENENDYVEVSEYEWNGSILTPSAGVNNGPSGLETYYNLPMDGVISMMQSLGYDYEYAVRDDGVKTFGGYVMCAANLELRPKGTLIQTSLGMGIVCDTGGFADYNPTQLDIAVDW